MSKMIFTETLHIQTDHPSLSGWYWFKIPKRLASGSLERKLNFFQSAKAEKYGPFATEEECHAAQLKTMEEQTNCIIEEVSPHHGRSTRRPNNVKGSGSHPLTG
jgi:hypothetical protein